ncbi:MAG TPA: hypothetical protein VK796_11710, partial [Cytophaga sp.]|nr:hypothetical protein [Cytophaga sp.]
MENQGTPYIKNSIEASIRLILFFGMIIFSYIILMPFISIILGGIILAVASSPILKILRNKFNMSDKAGAILITVVALIIFILPSYLLIHSLVNEFNNFLSEENNIKLTSFIENFKDLPVIGNSLYDFCKKAMSDTSIVFKEHASQIEAVGMSVLGFIASLGLGLLHFFASVIIAGLFLAHAKASSELA